MATDDNAMNINILMLGKTGHGKSATGNTILGPQKKIFVSGQSSTSVTKGAQKGEAIVENVKVTIIDTAGYADTSSSESNHRLDNYAIVKKQVEEALALCPDGFHVILYVLEATRVRPEEKESFECISSVVGKDNLKKFGILLFTHGSDILRGIKNKSITEWFQGEENLRKYLLSCENRGIICENLKKKITDRFRNQNKFVIDEIKKLKTINLNASYTHVHFAKAAKDRVKFDVETQKPQIDASVSGLISDIKKSISDLKMLEPKHQIEKADELMAMIKRKKDEVENADHGTGILNVTKYNIETCKSLIDETINQAKSVTEATKLEEQRKNQQEKKKIERQREIEQMKFDIRTQKILQQRRQQNETEIYRQAAVQGARLIWGIAELFFR